MADPRLQRGAETRGWFGRAAASEMVRGKEAGPGRRLGAWAWSAAVGFLALTWLTSSQITWSGDLAEPIAEPSIDRTRRKEGIDAGVDSIAASFGAATGDHALRRRGWVLRRALLLADLSAFVCATAIVELFVVKFDLGDPVVALLGLAGLGLWLLVALGYGLYANDEIQAVRSTADDLPGILLLGTLMAWIG